MSRISTVIASRSFGSVGVPSISGSAMLYGLGRLGLDFNANLVPDAQQEQQTYGQQTAWNAAHPDQLPPTETDLPSSGGANGGVLSSLFGGLLGKLFSGGGGNPSATFNTAYQSYEKAQSGVSPILIGILGFGALAATIVYISKHKKS